MRSILRIGIPSSLENSVFQLGRVLLVSLISTFGTVQIAANAVANNLDSLGCIPGQAVSLAVITVVGQCIGAGDRRQATGYAKKLVGIAYLAMIALNTVILLTLPWTLKMYNVSAETLQLSTWLVFIHDGFAMLLWPVAFVLPGALRAAGDVRFTMVVSVFSMWAFRILFSWILGSMLGWGAIGVWVAMLLTVAQTLMPEGTVRKIASFTGGLILLVALLQPVLGADLSRLDLDLDAYAAEHR